MSTSISEDDLFTYYLQKNMWHKGVDFEDFKKVFEDKGIRVINKEIGHDARKDSTKCDH